MSLQPFRLGMKLYPPTRTPAYVVNPPICGLGCPHVLRVSLLPRALLSGTPQRRIVIRNAERGVVNFSLYVFVCHVASSPS